jgi:hypothetical protein
MEKRKKTFDILRSICETKKVLTPLFIEENWTGCFLIIKWISFLNIEDKRRGALLAYLNKLTPEIFEDIYDQYMYLLRVMPKLKYCEYTYIKKTPKKILKRDKDYENVLKFLADSLELSREECKYYIDEGYVDFDNIKKSI